MHMHMHIHVRHVGHSVLFFTFSTAHARSRIQSPQQEGARGRCSTRQTHRLAREPADATGATRGCRTTSAQCSYSSSSIKIIIVRTILLQIIQRHHQASASDLGREGPQPARGWCGANAILATITSRKKLEFLSALVVLLNLLQRFQTMLPEKFLQQSLRDFPIGDGGRCVGQTESCGQR